MRLVRFASIALAVLLLAPASAFAQEYCPCVPTTPLWTVKTCDTWNCAMAELITANGDPLLLAMPADGDGRRWIVMRRVAGGSYQDDGSDAHVIAQLDGSTARWRRTQ